MDAKQRLLRAVHRESVDRPPLICPGGMMNPVVAELTELYDAPWPQAHYDADQMAKLARAIVTEGLFENYGVPFA